VTSSQFNILLGAIDDLRKEMNGRFDKVDGRMTPLEDERQQRIGADKKTSQIIGGGRATAALLVSLGTAIVAVVKLLGT